MTVMSHKFILIRNLSLASLNIYWFTPRQRYARDSIRKKWKIIVIIQN